ncbi:hypothetical protein CK203_096483 [Vitis vinifera]|uniref:Uncharacterized protein n=1 Tax=Vitis vinifera TaxID=29760 RepID=A0A438DGL4_VITVI|nr:hypothetical protein CK203_096483 [Vitis vinifera]
MAHTKPSSRTVAKPLERYCLAGTIGHKLTTGKPTKIDLDKDIQISVRCQVHTHVPPLELFFQINSIPNLEIFIQLKVLPGDGSTDMGSALILSS